MTGATVASGSGAIGTYTFNVGITTITWRAENVSGFDECTQLVTVVDNQPPSFELPPAFTDCVERLGNAVFNPATVDINPDRPEYFIFIPGNTALDLDPSKFADNCNLDCPPVEIRWIISMNDGSRIPILPDAYQNGQPSAYGMDILFQGDGINFTNVSHTITYWIVDCAGNVSDGQSLPITIKPRPKVVKANY